MGVTTLLLALAYLAVLMLRALGALWIVQRRAAVQVPAGTQAEVAILQPILGGDAHLQQVLAANLQALPHAQFVWLLDADDAAGNAAAATLVAQHPGVRFARITVPPAPPGINPKAWKLHHALPQVEAPITLILDDDAQLGSAALAHLLHDLAHADLVTALPYYQDGSTLAGRLLAQFVNNNAALTYLGWLPWAAPLTINGMCYAGRTQQLQAWGGFAPLLDQLTDDLAFAAHVRAQGGRLWQSTAPVAMRTALPDPASYVRQMHRWMLFALLLLRRQRPAVKLAIGALHGLPPWLLIATLLSACLQPGALSFAAVAGLLTVRAALLCLLQWRTTGASRHRPLLSLAAECLQPLHLLHAALVRTIRWRTRRYRVLPDGRFRAQ
ncbi:glycosyltransferase family 21 protein [Xanthomonas campestris]|uniref:glycosyltransferase family 21 protein n=1 Tax=Xanthomonas campestris TaxID=339 RepID=UPI001E33A6CC|nr:glycosyltransferase [Xanthomonas campestris]MCC8687493.1 glycosyltransferase [Xanthomonas campestris]MCW2000551.1 ceramide glucosyltransferase [Xanthomonas campestris]MEA9679632.1 glycosyltransferase [Xanthomonas campestris pv. raphani]MEA9699519.1 glycosyltransferase [Xanthomonas campestris pv. raphani]MEA9780268.1 glycosyltransferase [Xanthomonas campestris pv. raphani]